jgi:hypothetical protein
MNLCLYISIDATIFTWEYMRGEMRPLCDDCSLGSRQMQVGLLLLGGELIQLQLLALGKPDEF